MTMYVCHNQTTATSYLNPVFQVQLCLGDESKPAQPVQIPNLAGPVEKMSAGARSSVFLLQNRITKQRILVACGLHVSTETKLAQHNYSDS